MPKKRAISKADLIINVIKTTVEANPFVTAKQLCKLVKGNLSIDVSLRNKYEFQVYGYKKKGERLLITKTVPYAPTKTVIAAITSNELLHKECIIGSCNALIFLNFIKQLNL